MSNPWINCYIVHEYTYNGIKADTTRGGGTITVGNAHLKQTQKGFNTLTGTTGVKYIVTKICGRLHYCITTN